MRIVSIVGARPQFIKLAPLSKEIRKFHQEIIVHTGQHYDQNMSVSFFEDLGIPSPDYNLGIGSGPHGAQTGDMLEKIENILLDLTPDIVIVFGDTNSTLAGALAASKLGINSVHIEAGLRSFNKSMPEEINRVVSDHVADYLFAPTKTSITNLLREGLEEKSFFTGDIMVDSLKMAFEKVPKNDNSESDFILMTLHRPYNVDNPKKLSEILSKVNLIGERIIFPCHPRTRKMIKQNAIIPGSNISLIEPMGYLEFVKYQINSKMIITDSGGIQKEAYILQRPCITLRTETEWIETVESGWNLLVDPSIGISEFTITIKDFRIPEQYPEIFGNDVSKKMVQIINNI